MAGDGLEQFIGSILDEKKLSGIDPEVRTQLISDLKQRLLDQIDRAVIEALPDEKIDEFDALLDRPDTTDQTLHDFVANSGVDVKQVTTQTMLRFRDLYLETPEERES